MSEQLLLQQMERALVRAHLDEPDVLTDLELRRLRYVISFAAYTSSGDEQRTTTGMPESCAS